MLTFVYHNNITDMVYFRGFDVLQCILLRCGEDGLLLVTKAFLNESPGEQWYTHLQNERTGLGVSSAYRTVFICTQVFQSAFQKIVVL